MRRLLLILALSIAAPCWGQLPLLIQSGNADSSTTCVFPKAVTSGHRLFLEVQWQSTANTPSPTDTLSTTYGAAIFSDTGHNVRFQLFTGAATSSGSNTITATITSATEEHLTCFEFDWTGMSTTIDASSLSYYTTGRTSQGSGNITTTKTGDFLLTYASTFSTYADAPTDTFIGFISAASTVMSKYRRGGVPGIYNTTYNFAASGTEGFVFIIAFEPSAIKIVSPAIIPDAVKGSSYSYTMLGIGGISSYTWTVTSGALPPGVSLNSSTGEIYGTPTASAAGAFTVQLSDGTNTTTQSTTLNVGTSYNTITHVKDSDNTGVFSGNVTSGDAIYVSILNNTTFGVYACTDTLGTDFKYLSALNVFKTIVPSISVQFIGIAPSTGADTVTCVGTPSASTYASEYSNVQLVQDSLAFTQIAASVTSATSDSLTPLAENALLVSNYLKADNTGSLVVTAPCTQSYNTTTKGAGCYQVATTVTGYTINYTMPSTAAVAEISVQSFRPTKSGTAPQAAKGYPVIY